MFFAVAGVLVVLGVLIYLMAKGPSPEAMAKRIVATAQSQLPQGSLTAESVRVTAQEHARALEIDPDSTYVLNASAHFQQRLMRQLQRQVNERELDEAETILRAARRFWSDETVSSDMDKLHRAIDELRLIERIIANAAEVVDAVRNRSTDDSMSDSQLDAVESALNKLKRAFEIDKGDERIATLRRTLFTKLTSSSLNRVANGDALQASRLLDIAELAISDDDDATNDRHTLQEIRASIDKLASEKEIAYLLSQGESRLAAQKLVYPPGDSAVHFFRRVLDREPENRQARSGLLRVGKRYSRMASDALAQGDTEEAEVLLSRLSSLAPDHEDLGRLLANLAEAESLNRQPLAKRVANASGLPASQRESPLPSDAEGKLWIEVMNQCDGKQLRRYIEAYPAGRYIEEAWRKRSSCLGALSE